MRKTLAVLLATGVTVGLSACAGSPASDSCTSPVTEGSASRLVDATGSIGSSPEVDFPTPLVTDGIEVSVIERGEGRTLVEGQIVDFEVTAYNGETGKAFSASAYGQDAPIRRTAGSEADALGAALQCAEVGSRLAVTTTFADQFGEQTPDPSLGLEADSTVVLVVDVVAGYLGKANGSDQLPQSGFPAVVLAPNGQPGITIPAEEPPTELGVEVLKVGSGAKVEQEDQVVLHYTGLLWDSEESIFDSSWDRGVASTFNAVSLEDNPQGGLVPGFAEALIGQRVGSQFVVVIPPEFGYPEGQAPASIPAGSTMVFVVDVLGIEED